MQRQAIQAILFLAFLLATGCQRQAGRPAGKGAVADEPAAPLSPADSLMLKAEPVLLASLKRSPCYGRCPAYEVQFFYNGDAVYHGERYVLMQGIYLAQTPDSLRREILRLAQEIRFMGLLDAYPPDGPDLPDLPLTTTFLNNGTHHKAIANRYEAPLTLLRFEQFLDGVVQRLDWQPKVE